jgi:hypothetical protein
MPYIKDEVGLREGISSGDLTPQNAGELNYLISWLAHRYLKDKGLRYQNINEVIGVLECAKLEFYRMIAGKYEDKKRIENGAISNLMVLI